MFRNVLLTGASGFVGSRILSRLEALALNVIPVYRLSSHSQFKSTSTYKPFFLENFDSQTEWQNLLESIDIVIHCAARVHVMDDLDPDPMATYRAANVDGTLNLARQAALAGVKRFIFLSTVKVIGECTDFGRPYTSFDVTFPLDAYAISKAEAEAGLKLLSKDTGMEVVIIRPPLVYGPGVKGNFKSLMSWIASGLPLPFGKATMNRRSLVAVDNLVDLIIVCMMHSRAANQTFLVSDGDDLSTTELLIKIAHVMNRPAKLLNVPPSLLMFFAKIFGKSEMIQRLFGNLQVDITHTSKTLGWNPPISVEEGLRRAVQGFDQ